MRNISIVIAEKRLEQSPKSELIQFRLAVPMPLLMLKLVQNNSQPTYTRKVRAGL